jgi:hypothetical protein
VCRRAEIADQFVDRRTSDHRELHVSSQEEGERLDEIVCRCGWDHFRFGSRP